MNPQLQYEEDKLGKKIESEIHTIEQIRETYEDDFLDVKQDSMYPLFTNDPEYAKDYTVKINNNKLDKVFDKANQPNFNLQSIIIEDNYIKKKI